MDNFKEMSEVLGRASLASITKPDLLVEKLSKEQLKPKDTFHLVHVLSLFFGVIYMLPWVYFITANDYWMYKFRDTSSETVDLNKKTTLQKYFTSGLVVMQTAPTIVTMILATTYGHRFKVNPRLILSLLSINAIFIVYTIFIKINTDTWQVAFFLISLLSLSLISAFLNLFQVTAMVVISKFPQIYMKTFLFGQGMASVFSSGLQVISLALGTSTLTSALFYFVSGTSIIFITFVLYMVVQRMAFYQYYMQIELEDTKKNYSREDVKSAFFLIWPSLVTLLIILLTMYTSHPCVTSLIVSEFYGNGNRWNEVYFTPAITFLFGEFCSQFGRLVARPIMTSSNGAWIVGLTVLRMFILVPLVLFCNAQPRNYLPVLLPHDWEYILIVVVYFFTSGYLLNVATLSLPRLAKDKEDVAYLLFLGTLGIGAGVLSPLSLVTVRVL